jgi:xanthine/uracil/vitamin C permease (AzgA family)
LGSLALAISAGVTIGLITYAVLKVFKKAKHSKTTAVQKNHA